MPRPRVIRTDFSRGEAILGVGCLCLGSLISWSMQVYLLTVCAPLAWVFAGCFCGVLTATARLWSPRLMVTLLPLVVWTVACVAWLVWYWHPPAVAGNNISACVLVLAGVAGGVWPVRSRR